MHRIERVWGGYAVIVQMWDCICCTWNAYLLSSWLWSENLKLFVTYHLYYSYENQMLTSRPSVILYSICCICSCSIISYMQAMEAQCWLPFNSTKNAENLEIFQLMAKETTRWNIISNAGVQIGCQHTGHKTKFKSKPIPPNNGFFLSFDQTFKYYSRCLLLYHFSLHPYTGWTQCMYVWKTEVNLRYASSHLMVWFGNKYSPSPPSEVDILELQPAAVNNK